MSDFDAKAEMEVQWANEHARQESAEGIIADCEIGEQDQADLNLTKCLRNLK